MFALRRAAAVTGLRAASAVRAAPTASTGVAGLRALSTQVATPTASTPSKLGNPLAEFDSQDGAFEKDRVEPGTNHKEFTYFLLGGGRFVYASTARVILIQFVASMSASADVLAMANAEVDLSPVPMGQGMTIKWRGKPIFVRRRTEDEIEAERNVPMHALRDEETDDDRTIKPEWLVLVGICTHLGCVPISNAGEYHGWFCPCHGSHYDLSGRIRKGPAPLNMEIPPYKFMEEEKIMIG